MARRFVKEKKLGFAIQRPCENNSLSLASRQRAPHITDNGLITHGHSHDIGVDCSNVRAEMQMSDINFSCKACDVLRNGSRKQSVFLKDKADMFAEVGKPK